MCLCFDCINTAEVGVIERFGKYNRLVEAGCIAYCWPYENIVGRVSLRVQEETISLETKTDDNVFVTVSISIQYQAIADKVYSAFYVLDNPSFQMRAYVSDVVRSAICTMTLDQAFESKIEISQSLKSHLQEVMATYGFLIVSALVTDLTPDKMVKDAMNEINTARRYKETAFNRAEGEKVLKVKRAEAEAESMYLSGVGVARQRRAIMDGLKDSIVDFSSAVSETTPKDVMELLVLNQYFDTLSEVGKGGSTKVVFLNHESNPTRAGIMQANASIGF
jgi:regulator of protease activity HflC (stomatin/prohibitin superfamily)